MTTDPTRPSWSGLALVCLAGVVWGTIGPAVEVIDDRSALSVWTVGAYRAATAVTVLLLAVALTHRAGRCRALATSQPVRVAAVGVFTGTFMVLFFVSVVSVGVSVGTVVALGWAPVLLQLLRLARAPRSLAAGEILAVGAAVTGLLLVGTAGGADAGAPNPVLGVVTALCSGTAYALSAELAGPLRAHDPVTVAAVTMSVAAVVLVGVGLTVAVVRGEALATPDVTSWLLVLYLGMGTMALAYVLLFAGLRTTPSRTAVVATLLEPVTAVLIAVLFLGERLDLAGALGALLILGAIASIGRRTSTPAPQ